MMVDFSFSVQIGSQKPKVKNEEFWNTFYKGFKKTDYKQFLRSSLQIHAEPRHEETKTFKVQTAGFRES